MRNPCKECDYYRKNNNVCQSKKCSVRGGDGTVTIWDRLFCEPYKCVKGAKQMSEMIVKLKQNHVKIKGCEYIRDLIRCVQCRYAQNKVCSHPNNNGCCINDNHYCGYAEVKEDE